MIATRRSPSNTNASDIAIESLIEPHPVNRRRTPFSKTHPAIAAEWYYPNNCSFGPEDFSYGSHVSAFWQCSNKHIFRQRIGTRCIRGVSCPYCSGKKVSKETSLAYRDPELAKEFDTKKNGKATPSDFTTGSNEKVWWRCTQNPQHTWQASIKSRTNGGSCPYCIGRRVSKETSLAYLHPDIATEWHPTKNGNTTPSDFTTGSNEKVWWRCQQNPQHTWQAPIKSRTNGGFCPYCIGRRVSKETSLAYLHPDIAKEFHPKKNGNTTASDFTTGSKEKVWWLCQRNPQHVWQAEIKQRTKLGSSCPYCIGRRVSKETSLAYRHPKLAKEFDTKKNGKATPSDFTTGSNHKIWWRCPRNPEHTWQTSIKHRAKRGSSCPHCTRNTIDLRNYPGIYRLFDRDKNKEIDPTRFSTKKLVAWRCPEGKNHTWIQPFRKRSKTMRCPFCSSLSFRFPDLFKEVDPKRNKSLKLETLAACSHTKIWWRCSINEKHTWQESPHNRTKRGRSNPLGCPDCRYR